MVKEIKKLERIIGSGNLLEALFIFLGSFQHCHLGHNNGIDRNFRNLSEFIEKEEEPLDNYFKLMFSLQGLFLIYIQAYKILKEDVNLSTHEVIDKVYKGANSYKLINAKIFNQKLLSEDQKKLEFLNFLGSPKGKSIFTTEEDFEGKILTSIRKLLNKEQDESHIEFTLIKYVVNYYYSIHQEIKVDKDIALLFSIGSDYKKLSKSYKILIKKEHLPIIDNPIIIEYISYLAKLLQKINLKNIDNIIKYTFDLKDIDDFDGSISGLIEDREGNNLGFLYPKNLKSILECLLEEQDSKKFEKIVTKPKNVHYLPYKKIDLNIFDNNNKREEYKNTVCKLILGVFILSVMLCAADYLFMGQDLLNPMKNVLPQNDIVNLVIASVLTIIIVYSLFQLLKPSQKLPPKQEPPSTAVNGVALAEKEVLNNHSAQNSLNSAASR